MSQISSKKPPLKTYCRTVAEGTQRKLKISPNSFFGMGIFRGWFVATNDSPPGWKNPSSPMILSSWGSSEDERSWLKLPKGWFWGGNFHVGFVVFWAIFLGRFCTVGFFHYHQTTIFERICLEVIWKCAGRYPRLLVGGSTSQCCWSTCWEWYLESTWCNLARIWLLAQVEAGPNHHLEVGWNNHIYGFYRGEITPVPHFYGHW